MTVKPLVTEMKKAKLSARTVNKYVEYIGQIDASLNGGTGEPPPQVGPVDDGPASRQFQRTTPSFPQDRCG